MKAFTDPLHELAGWGEMVSSIAAGDTPVQVEGCIDAQKCHIIYAAGNAYPFKLVVTYDESRVREIAAEYSFYEKNVRIYPAKDTIFFSADIHNDLISGQRLAAIRPLIDGEPVTIVTTIDGLQDGILDLEFLCGSSFTLRKGDELNMDTLAEKMTRLGYVRESQVEAPGQFALRGSIFDFYNQGDDCPYRVDLWGDEIDSIRSFDAQSQRSLDELDEVTVYPAAEYIFDEKTLAAGLHSIELEMKRQAKKLREQGRPEAAHNLEQVTKRFREDVLIDPLTANVDSYAGYFFSRKAEDEPHLVNLLDYFEREKSLIIVDEPARVEERGRDVTKEYVSAMTARLENGYVLPGQTKAVRSCGKILGDIAGRRTLLLTMLSQTRKSLAPAHRYSGFSAAGLRSYRGDFRLLVSDMQKWKRRGYRMILVSRAKSRGQRLARELLEEGLSSFYSENFDLVPEPRQVMVVHGSFHSGVEYPQIKFVIIGETDIFGEERNGRRSRRKSSSAADKLLSLDDLKVGDYVVSEHYGVGIYRGIEQIRVDGVLRDHVKIEYADGGSLYVLASHLDSIQKYAGRDAENVKISRMDSREWHKTTSGVRKAVDELAEDIVRLYAVRETSKGYACGPDTPWQAEFEQLFPYQETKDQLDAVRDVKQDMESTKIMDRLICGDVGFGKTEIALRAAFKMVQEGRQVAVLVPTTVLAQQHYNTFTQRMKDYPIRIGLLSRFCSSAEIHQTVLQLKDGDIDIVIGTHRLLSKDVAFHNLGLLIVDEEQRFGVTHKEKIKKLRETVDCLTLTATPIPRTMHMSLIGVRDISLLEEAPVDRLPIQTYVMEFSEETVREAIRRELARGGQVYYIYNRVNGIDNVVDMVKRLVPEARVACAHGQMPGRQVEDIMYSFVNRDLDVLISTTIVETGLDIPNANTMIIQNAENLGLAQLYQLRGRVGRSGRTAYAFLMYQRDRLLRESAEKRLGAIREFTQLGSGYKIAMRDLEIRGAGSLLGKKQSGHMAKVGYDLYVKMLNRAIAQARGEKPKVEFDTTVEPHVDAFLPDSYITNEQQKLSMYKRIATIQTQEEYSDLIDEMTDRYGEIPAPAKALAMIALIRSEAHEAWMTELRYRDMQLECHMYPRAPIQISRIAELTQDYGDRVHFQAGKKDPVFRMDLGDYHSDIMLMFEDTRKFIRSIHGLLSGADQEDDAKSFSADKKASPGRLEKAKRRHAAQDEITQQRLLTEAARRKKAAAAQAAIRRLDEKNGQKSAGSSAHGRMTEAARRRQKALRARRKESGTDGSGKSSY